MSKKRRRQAEIHLLSPDHLVLDEAIQPRVELNSGTIGKYEADYRNPDSSIHTAPEAVVRVVYDGLVYWVWDGFHRVTAARLAGLKDVRCVVTLGPKRDAILLAAGANEDHGLLRSNADKIRVVRRFLNDPGWADWSDRLIAEHCRVSHPFVSSVRGSDETLLGHGLRHRVSRHGAIFTLHAEPEPEAVTDTRPLIDPPLSRRQKADVQSARVYRSMADSGIAVRRKVACEAGIVDLVTEDSCYFFVPMDTREEFLLAVGQALVCADLLREVAPDSPRRAPVLVGHCAAEVGPLLPAAANLKVEVRSADSLLSQKWA